jgi:hypothetical protein
VSHHIHPWSHDLRRQQSALKQQEKAPCPCVCVCACVRAVLVGVDSLGRKAWGRPVP